MKKKPEIVGSALLDDYWRATAFPPRDYPGQHAMGIDVLGAMALSKQKPKKTVTARAAAPTLTRAAWEAKAKKVTATTKAPAPTLSRAQWDAKIKKSQPKMKAGLMFEKEGMAPTLTRAQFDALQNKIFEFADGGGGGGETEPPLSDIPPSNTSAPPSGGTPSGGEGGGETDSAPSEEYAPAEEEYVPAEGEGGDESESEAVQRFRESGGEWDPFADEEEQQAEAPPEGITIDEEGNVLNDEGEPLDEEGNPLPRRMRGAELLEEEMLSGLTASDYNFEISDLFMPHQALQRTWEEAAAKQVAPIAFQRGNFDQTAPVGKPSPEIAARLTAAQKRLKALQKQEQQMKAARLKAALMSAAQAAAANAAIPDEPPPADEATIMGDNFDPFDDDLHMRGWQRQITDPRPDPIRKRASVHRGSAYLDPKYPPWVSSSGQEGGEMMPEEEVDVMGGCHEQGTHAHGIDVLGGIAAVQKTASKMQTVSAKVTGALRSAGASPKAAEAGGKAAAKVTPRAGFALKKTAGGRKFTALVPLKPKSGRHNDSIKNALDAGKRAVAVGKKLDAALKKKKLNVKPAAASKPPVAGKRPTGVHGLAPITMRKTAAVRTAAATLPKKGGKIHLSAPQAAKIAREVQKQGNVTIDKANKHKSYINNVNTKLKAGVTSVQKKTNPNPRTRVHGEDTEEILGLAALEAQCDVMGEELLADIVGDALEAFYGEGEEEYVPTDDEAYYDEASASGVAGPPDYGIGPPPTTAPPLEPGSYTPAEGNDDPTSVYSSNPAVSGVPLPEGAVIYDGVQAFPDHSVGSYTRMTKTWYRGLPPKGGGQGGDVSGFEWTGEPPLSWLLFFHDAVMNNWAHPDPNEVDSLPVMAAASVEHSWGPLIGNQTMPDWKGLRYDMGGNKFFWFRDTAPKWATAPDDLSRLNQAVVDYQALLAVAKADYANQVLQDQLDQKAAEDELKAQAKEDAAQQRAYDQETKQVQQEAAIQAVADQTAYEQESQQVELESKAWREAEMTQADIDQRAMEAQAAIEQRELETLARLAAMEQRGQFASADEGAYYDEEMPPSRDYEEESFEEMMPEAEEANLFEPLEEQGVQLETDAPFDVDDVMGMVRGLNKHRLKRALRSI